MNIKSKNNKIIFLLIIFLLIETISIFISWNNNSAKETLSKDKENNKYKNVAILIEQTDGTYKESDLAVWPSNMDFDAEKSGCIDIDGNVLENVLTFDGNNNIASATVTDTAFCYLYFNIPR